MPGLLDIAPPEVLSETIEIRGGTLTLRGFTAREYAGLLRRFPKLGVEPEPAAAGGEEGAEPIAKPPPSGEEMLADFDLQLAIIAAGLGEAGNAQTEAEIDRRLTEAERKQAFDIVTRLTREANPNPPLGAGADGAPAASPGTNSPSPSSS